MSEHSKVERLGGLVQHVVPKPIFRHLLNTYNTTRNTLRFKQRLQTIPSIGKLDKDVLFVVVDCLRSDHTSMEEYKRDTTPFLSEFGDVYANAVSAAPWTFPSVPSLLTGKYPHEHGATFSNDFSNFDTGNLPGELRDNIYTLSELFAKQSYSTYFSSAIVTASLATNGRFEKMNVSHNARAEPLVDDFIDWWKKTENRFGYLHLGDLHQPLHIPESQPFGEIDKELREVVGWDFRNEAESDGDFDYYHEQRIKLYDTILAEVDGEIERLVGFLQSEGDFEDTIIVIVGDHGEEFWEHADRERESYQDPRGYYGIGHGHNVFEEVARVPLVVHGLSDDLELPPTSSTTDIAPLVLREAVSKLAVESSEDLLVGSNFANDSNIVLSEGIGYGYEKKAIYDGEYKYIHSVSEEEPDFLFDLASGGEEHDVDNPEKRRELANLLPNVDASNVAEVSMDAKTRDQLKDLGYI